MDSPLGLVLKRRVRPEGLECTHAEGTFKKWQEKRVKNFMDTNIRKTDNILGTLIQIHAIASFVLAGIVKSIQSEFNIK